MKGGYMTPAEYAELVKASKQFNDIDGTIAEKMDKSTKHDYIKPTDGTFDTDFKLLDKKEQGIRIENFKTENDKLTKVDEYPYKNSIVDPIIRPIVDPIVRPIVDPIVRPIVQHIRPIVQPIYYDYDRREKEKLIEMIIDLIKNRKYGKTVIEQQIDKVIENYNNNTRDPDDNIRKIAEQMLKNYTSKTSNKKPIKQKSKKKKSIKSKKKKKSKKSKKKKK